MSIMDSLKRALGIARAPATPAQAPVHSRDPEPEQVKVQEVTAADLLSARQRDAAQRPFLIDIREPHERKQGYIDDDAFIPMNSLPARLGELPRNGEIVVYCAHGNRSYAVTAWLAQQGFRARSLTGGIAAWQAIGGAISR